MAEYRSLYRGEDIDEAVSRALNLMQTIGLDADQIMSQKEVTEHLQTKMDKESGKVLSSNDFTDEDKEKLNKLNHIFEISLSPDRWGLLDGDIYMQKVSVQSIKSTDTAVAEISLSNDNTLSQKEQEYWSNITKIELCDGFIKAYLQGTIPDITLNIRIKI